MKREKRLVGSMRDPTEAHEKTYMHTGMKVAMV